MVDAARAISSLFVPPGACDRPAAIVGKRKIDFAELQDDVAALAASPSLVVIPMPEDPAGYARSLYATLHALDQRGLDHLVVDTVPTDSDWAAVHDRLERAAT